MKHWLVRALLLVGIVTVLFASAAGWTWYELTRPIPITDAKNVVIPRGAGFSGIAETLQEENIIRYPLLFKLLAVIESDPHRFKAGEYAFAPGMNIADVLEKFAKGEMVIRKFTIPEGWTTQQIINALNADKTLSGEIPPGIKEGTLLPETYHYSFGDLRSELIDRMKAGMKEALSQAWGNRAQNLPFATPEEALVLASIIEKETSLPHERQRVAAVYINRLKRGMKLQADPTVAYGIEKRDGAAMTRPLTYADLAAPTPYNTYVNTGLPPGPIANPGKSSIEAAVQPLPSSELYFVADGTGAHNFAESLEAHNRNVAEYRKIQRQGK